MKDSEFKRLNHMVGDNRIGSRGTAVCQGYKPDVTVVDANNRLKFILESEQKTDRKAFLGNVIKAEKYAEECNASPMLIIVMQPQQNTTVEQIAEHLQPYAVWLRQRLNEEVRLSGIFVISDSEYLSSAQAQELLGSNAFVRRGRLVAV